MTEEDLDAIATVQYQLDLLSRFSFTPEELIKYSVDQVKRVDGNLVGRVLYDNEPLLMTHGRGKIHFEIIKSKMPAIKPEDIIDSKPFD